MFHKKVERFWQGFMNYVCMWIT